MYKRGTLDWAVLGQNKLIFQVATSLNKLFRPLYASFVEEIGGKMNEICDGRAREGKEERGERKGDRCFQKKKE